MKRNRIMASSSAKESSIQLCKLGDLPKHLQFNKDIWTGYRKPMSSRSCMKSWTYLHNESFNCYSHGKGISIFMRYMKRFLQFLYDVANKLNFVQTNVCVFVGLVEACLVMGGALFHNDQYHHQYT